MIGGLVLVSGCGAGTAGVIFNPRLCNILYVLESLLREERNGNHSFLGIENCIFSVM
jgi:hypothetical protein